MVLGYTVKNTIYQGRMMARKKQRDQMLPERQQELIAAKVSQSLMSVALKSLFNLSQDMLCVADFDGFFQIINPAFQKTLGYTREELLKIPFIELVHVDDRKPTMDAMEHLEAGKSVTYFENRYRCKDGSYKWLAWKSVPVTDERYIYAVARDITESKAAEEELQRYQRELARIMRLGTIGEMASGIAHELNQPLTALVSYCGSALSLVNSLSLPSQQLHEILGRAKEQAQRASNIIRHLREFVSKEDGDKDLLDLDHVIRDIIKFLNFEVQDSGVRIIYYPASQSCKIRANKIQLDQVLVNLVRNSIEAIMQANIPAGRVVVQTRLLPNDSVEVTVRDNGPGINTEMIDIIFNPFQTSKATGMGIGLPLCRSILEALGGRLWVDKDYQDGALFGLELPVSR
jgi:PAS domain S-box-containing protein